jgi:hypothetical protein
MNKLQLLSAGLVAATMFATPALACESQMDCNSASPHQRAAGSFRIHVAVMTSTSGLAAARTYARFDSRL